jgi:hypothetical protein
MAIDDAIANAGQLDKNTTIAELESQLRLAKEEMASLAAENLHLSNRNLALLASNDDLQATKHRHDEEVAVLVKTLEVLDPALGLKTIENVVIYAAEQLRTQAKTIVELQEDLKEAEAEAARFAKENRHMSARSRELLAEIAAFKAAQLPTPSKPASPLDRIPSDPPLDLMSALDRANEMVEARGHRTPNDSPPDSDDLPMVKLDTLSSQGETIDLSRITKAPLTGDSFETFANYFIIETIVSLDRLSGNAVAKIFDGKGKIVGAKILLMINGVVVPFLDALRRFHEQWDPVVRKAAIELVKEQFREKTSNLFSLLDSLEERLEVVLGVPKDEE